MDLKVEIGKDKKAQLNLGLTQAEFVMMNRI